MDDNGRFGFDPEDFEHVIRDATEGLREAFEGVGRFFTVALRTGWVVVGLRGLGAAHPDQAGNHRRSR